MSELNPLNDLSRIYLDKVALMNRQEEQNDVERWQGVLDDQMEKSSKKLATLGAPTMEEEKKAAKDYDGDGKVESGKDEYFGSKDKAIKKAMKKEELEAVDESRLVKKLTRPIRKAKKVAGRVAQWYDDDPGRAHTMGSLGNPHMRNDEKRAAERKAGKKKVEEGYGKIETPEKVVGKVLQPKKVDAPKGSKMKKEETYNYVEAYVAELKKTTLGSYVSKASQNLSDRRFDQGRSEKATYEPDADDDKEEMKLRQREKGISRAAKKLSKEELELAEADSLAAQTARWEAARQRRMKQRQSYERPHWIPRDQDHEDRYGSSKGEKKKVKEGRFSDWRDDLSDLIEVAPMTDVEMEKEVTEKKVNNKVVINPKMSEAVAQIGGEVISETEVDLQEKQKDTPDQVKAVIAYDRARKGTDDATYDSMHGKKKQAKKERDYAKWQRDKGAEDAQKSGHRWKHAKGSTREKEGKKSETHAYIKDSVEYILHNLHNLNEADIADILARLEKKRISKGGNPDESPLGKKVGQAMKSQQDKARKKAGMSEGYGKKKKHDCASKVKHEEFGIGNCIKGMHTIDENNMVTHYDVEFAQYIVENCPVEELEILVSEMHSHATMKEGIVNKEVKALQKAGKTLKDTPVVNADKIDTPNYKGQKFGVKEDDDWIQKAVKRPGAFTRKAKAAGQSVQQFAKTVDANPGKYSTRTKRQANLAQTFASMKKEDVEELFYTLIVD